jgi:LysR family nitrogen assimilation transcriptional regulator
MAQLEAELGVELFLRSRRGVALTEAGPRLYPQAVSILRQTTEAAQAARSGSGEPSGKVVFGIPHSVSHALALPLLRAVRQALPQVRGPLSATSNQLVRQAGRVGQGQHQQQHMKCLQLHRQHRQDLKRS